MNNSFKITLENENGMPRVYGEIPDLWHLYSAIVDGSLNCHIMEKQQREIIANMVLETWHMAHDFKAVLEQQGAAKIVEIEALKKGTKS